MVASALVMIMAPGACTLFSRPPRLPAPSQPPAASDSLPGAPHRSWYALQWFVTPQERPVDALPLARRLLGDLGPVVLLVRPSAGSPLSCTADVALVPCRGYSLAFSDTASNPFIGNLDYFGLKGVLDAPSVGSSKIPALLFCLYQGSASSLTLRRAPRASADAGSRSVRHLDARHRRRRRRRARSSPPHPRRQLHLEHDRLLPDRLQHVELGWMGFPARRPRFRGRRARAHHERHGVAHLVALPRPSSRLRHRQARLPSSLGLARHPRHVRRALSLLRRAFSS